MPTCYLSVMKNMRLFIGDKPARRLLADKQASEHSQDPVFNNSRMVGRTSCYPIQETGIRSWGDPEVCASCGRLCWCIQYRPPSNESLPHRNGDPSLHQILDMTLPARTSAGMSDRWPTKPDELDSCISYTINNKYLKHPTQGPRRQYVL